MPSSCAENCSLLWWLQTKCAGHHGRTVRPGGVNRNSDYPYSDKVGPTCSANTEERCCASRKHEKTAFQTKPKLDQALGGEETRIIAFSAWPCRFLSSRRAQHKWNAQCVLTIGRLWLGIGLRAPDCAGRGIGGLGTGRERSVPRRDWSSISRSAPLDSQVQIQSQMLEISSRTNTGTGGSVSRDWVDWKFPGFEGSNERAWTLQLSALLTLSPGRCDHLIPLHRLSCKIASCDG